MKAKLASLLFIIILLSSCASLPKATVEMSMLLEKQINILEENHLDMVTLYFDEKEKLAIEFLENEWYPMFLDKFYEKETITAFHEETLKLTDPLKRKENIEMLTTVIQENYMAERDSLITPIQKAKKEMTALVREEYNKARVMNAAITNNIASVNDIQEKRKELLSNIVDYESLENQLNERLAQLDDLLEQGQKTVDEYNKNEDKIDELLNKLK